MIIHSGIYRSITLTAVGQALLSLKSDVEMDALTRRANAEATSSYGRVDETEFGALIKRVRERGYSETSGEQANGTACVAIAMYSPVDLNPLSIGVAMPPAVLEAKRSLALAALYRFRSAIRSAPLGGLVA